MNVEIKTNISKGLKRHYRKKKLKNMLVRSGLILAVILSIAVLSFKPDALADYPDRHTHLPQAKDETNLSIPNQVRLIALRNDFKDIEYLLKLINCESRFDPYATNLNGGHSLDAGLLQINQRYNKQVGLQCSFDINCSTEWAIKEIKAGRQWKWMCDKIVNPQGVDYSS